MGELIRFPSRRDAEAPALQERRQAPTVPVERDGVPAPADPPTRTRHPGQPQTGQPQPGQPQLGQPLWRELVGTELRAARLAQSRTQADVAERAGISVQYLSEIERGRKEPSSEILAAVSGALDLRLLDLTVRVARTLSAIPVRTSRPSGPVALAA